MTTLLTNKKNATIKEAYSVASNPRNNAIAVATPVVMVIGCLMFAALFATELISWNFFDVENIQALKFLPVLVIFFATTLAVLVQPPHRTVYNIIATMRANWFLTGFISLALPGAVYARFIVKQNTSYFTVILMMLVFMETYFVLLSVPHKYLIQIRLWILRSFGLLAVIAGIALLKGMFIDDGKAFPGTVILLTQALGLVFYFTSGLRRRLLFLLVVVLTIFTFKNTAIIILLISCLSFYVFPKSFTRKFSISNLISLGIIGLIVLVTIGGAYFALQGNYSDGSYSFRSAVYKAQFYHFLESPIFGEFFMRETAVLFGAQNLLITAHNDWLDVMAQGGLVGLFLFAGALVYISRRLIKTRNRQIQYNPVGSKFASWQLQFILAVTISFTFNPILGDPDTALIVWIVMAFAHYYAREFHLKK